MHLRSVFTDSSGEDPDLGVTPSDQAHSADTMLLFLHCTLLAMMLFLNRKSTIIMVTSLPGAVLDCRLQYFRL